MTGGSSLEKLATMSITGKGLSFLILGTYIHTQYGRERKEKKQFKLTRIAREQKRADNTYSVHT